MENKFSYNYSADRNEELRKIREKYAVKTDDEQSAVQRIRAMDRKIELPGKIIGIVFGLTSTLIFGSGLALCIQTNGLPFVMGIFLGILGLVGMGSAPAVAKKIFEQQKAKHGAEIIRLIDESMGKLY
ncbi:MAG: hypothetical protein MJ178_10650 [Treponemataceae bacterium]|nr:hypothetical protein [Treponemataceae bacterium]